MNKGGFTLIKVIACGLTGLLAWAGAGLDAAPVDSGAPIIVGSKKFTESVILGDIVAGTLRGHGLKARHRREIGGTRVLWSALVRGDIQAYVEYTGTIEREIFRGRSGVSNRRGLKAALAKSGVTFGPLLGFNNTYVLGMRAERARALNIVRISDLARHANLNYGLTAEFLKRGDGWPGLRRAYGLPGTRVRGMDHDLSYRGLARGDLDVIDLYATDAEIAYYKIRALQDDRRFFPEYQAVLLYRSDLAAHPRRVLDSLAGSISARRMIRMNRSVKIDRRTEPETARAFLRERFGARFSAAAGLVDSTGLFQRLLNSTFEHLRLVGISLGLSLILALPLGVISYRHARLGAVVLTAAGIVQTVPSLALLVLMIPLFGIGAGPAIASLLIYSLLPIIRNTHAGLSAVAPEYRESARALGLRPIQILRYVELPLAARTILAGIKISAVINVGTATLGALVGAGGYGQAILTGIRLDDMGLILEGALPAALLALLVQGLFELAERAVVSPGLRLPAQR